jgi:hypothetical protein
MPTLSVTTYQVDANFDYVLSGGSRIVVSTASYQYSLEGAETRNSGRSRMIRSFDIAINPVDGQCRLRVNKNRLIGLFDDRDHAVGALFGAFMNSGVGSKAAIEEMMSDQISRSVSTLETSAIAFNSFGMLLDTTFYDDLYGFGDGTANGTQQDETFNPEPASGYTGRTDLLALGASAINNTDDYYYTVFDSERLIAGETDWYFTDGSGYQRINPTHVVTRITNALADGYYYGRTDLVGAILQLDLETNPLITNAEEASSYWDHPEFDQGPWLAIRQDIIDTINLVRETFGCYVTWYAVPRMSHFLQYHRDTVSPYTALRPAKLGFTDFTNSGFYSDVIPENPTAASWQERLLELVEQAWIGANGPIMDVLDGAHIRYYVNRSLNDSEYTALGSTRSNRQQWIEQKHNLEFCQNYIAANNLEIPLLPTTAPYTVGGGSGMAGYGQSVFTIIHGWTSGETTATVEVWVNDVVVATSGYTVTQDGTSNDAVVTITAPVIVAADEVRINWHYGSTVKNSSIWDDVKSYEAMYDGRLCQIASWDAKICDIYAETQPEAVTFWTSGVGLFAAWTLDLTRDGWDNASANVFSTARKPSVADWRIWTDLNYVTGGWLFDGLANRQDAKAFWNADLVHNVAGLRDKWIKTFTTYINSHYAAPLVGAVNDGATIPPRHWANFDFDTDTWDANDMIVEGTFFTGAPTITDLGSLWQIAFTTSAGVQDGPQASGLITNRSQTQLTVTLADGTVCGAAGASQAATAVSFFVVKPAGSPVITGATGALQDFYPSVFPPNALHSSVANV